MICALHIVVDVRFGVILLWRKKRLYLWKIEKGGRYVARKHIYSI